MAIQYSQEFPKNFFSLFKRKKNGNYPLIPHHIYKLFYQFFINFFVLSLNIKRINILPYYAFIYTFFHIILLYIHIYIQSYIYLKYKFHFSPIDIKYIQYTLENFNIRFSCFLNEFNSFSIFNSIYPVIFFYLYVGLYVCTSVGKCILVIMYKQQKVK